MKYLETGSTDPEFNLALEQHVFDTLSLEDEFFMLWQNSDAVIVGLHQNTAEEINREYVERRRISVVRRCSGGGAVFHDLHGINFTFVTRASGLGFDMSDSCRPILDAVLSLGVSAEFSGRNDMTIGGRKFSGGASYLRDGRLLYHGTLLFDADFEKMSAALRPPEDKIVSKGVKSIRGRVTNIREHLPRDMTVTEFWEHLRRNVARNMPAHTLMERDLDAANKIRSERYGTWEWNFGRSPDYGIKKRRYIPGFGAIRVSMEVQEGRIAAFKTDGDYFGVRTCNDVAAALLGVKPDAAALRDALAAIPLGEYYSGLARDDFIRIILE